MRISRELNQFVDLGNNMFCRRYYYDNGKLFEEVYIKKVYAYSSHTNHIHRDGDLPARIEYSYEGILIKKEYWVNGNKLVTKDVEDRILRKKRKTIIEEMEENL